MSDDDRRDRALEIGKAIMANPIANHLAHDALGHRIEGRDAAARELEYMAVAMATDAPNYFVRIKRMHADPDAPRQFVVDETCAHKHRSRNEAEACMPGTDHVLERDLDGVDVEVYRIR